jgi:hypothetical protein
VVSLGAYFGAPGDAFRKSNSHTVASEISFRPNTPTAWGGQPRSEWGLVRFGWAPFLGSFHRGVRCGKAPDACPPMSLVGMHLWWACISGGHASLVGMHLWWACISGGHASLVGMHLSGMRLLRARISYGVPRCVSLTGMYLIGVHLIGVSLMGVHLVGLHPIGVHLISVHVMGYQLHRRQH